MSVLFFSRMHPSMSTHPNKDIDEANFNIVLITELFSLSLQIAVITNALFMSKKH